MKKAVFVILTAVLCFSLCACGGTTIKGDLTAYWNADQSFSIDLPTTEDAPWVVNKKASGDTLDISDAEDTVNLYIQCLSKRQAQYIASDLESYEQYAIVNTLGQLISDMDLKEAEIKTPEFITASKAQSFTLKSGGTTAKGNLLFMESATCYYTYLILAVEEAYDGNKDVLLESVLSLKELTDATPQTEATEPSSQE